MEIMMNNVCISNIVDSRTFEEVYLDTDFSTPIKYNTLEEFYSTEGIIMDVAKGVKTTVSTARKAGRAGYKAIASQSRNIKSKWYKIKPIIIKAIKDLGITLSNMYGRFMKYDKDYVELGKKIDIIINSKVPLMGKSDVDILIDMYDINVDTLSNVCKMVESYQGFVSIVVNDFIGSKNFITPENFVKLVESNININSGTGNIEKIRSSITPMVDTIGKLNSNGELTIPNKIWTDRKWYMPVNVPFAKKRNERKKWQKDLDNSSAAGFTKNSITGQLEEITISGDNIEEFKNLLVKGKNGGYLNIMKDFLNNRIIANTLQKSGASLKKETKTFFSNLDKFSNILTDISKRYSEAQIRNNNTEDINQNNTSTPNTNNTATTTPEKLINPKQKLSNSDDGSLNTADDSLEGIVETYIDAITSFFMNSSSVYGSMVNGLTAASFEIIVNCKHIVDKIESINNLNEKKVK